MKKQTLYLISFAAFVIMLGISFGFKPAATLSYQHMTIIAEHPDLDGVNVSIDGKEYSHLSLKKQSQGAWDMNPILNLVQQYESEGWELQNFSSVGNFHSLWLRKAKK